MRRSCLRSLASVSLSGIVTAVLAAAPPQSAPAPAARIKIDIDRTIGPVDPLLFGNFAEHLGRMI